MVFQRTLQVQHLKEPFEIHHFSTKMKLPIRGQESILRSAGFNPSQGVPDNFWGLKPPN